MDKSSMELLVSPTVACNMASMKQAIAPMEVIACKSSLNMGDFQELDKPVLYSF